MLACREFVRVIRGGEQRLKPYFRFFWKVPRTTRIQVSDHGLQAPCGPLLPASRVPFLCFAPSSHTRHLLSVTLTCTFLLSSKPLHLLFPLLGVLFLAVSTWLIVFSASGLSSDTHSTQSLPCHATPSKGDSPYDPPQPSRSSLSYEPVHLTAEHFAFWNDLCLFSFYWLFCFSLSHPEELSHIVVPR